MTHTWSSALTRRPPLRTTQSQRSTNIAAIPPLKCGQDQRQRDSARRYLARLPRSCTQLPHQLDVPHRRADIDDHAQHDQRHARRQRQARGVQPGLRLAPLYLAQKQPEPRHREAHAHQPKPGAQPRQQGSFRREVNPWVVLGIVRHTLQDDTFVAWKSSGQAMPVTTSDSRARARARDVSCTLCKRKRSLLTLSGNSSGSLNRIQLDSSRQGGRSSNDPHPNKKIKNEDADE